MCIELCGIEVVQELLLNVVVQNQELSFLHQVVVEAAPHKHHIGSIAGNCLGEQLVPVVLGLGVLKYHFRRGVLEFESRDNLIGPECDALGSDPAPLCKTNLDCLRWRCGDEYFLLYLDLNLNRDLLDAAGVEYPDGTWDWGDYLAAYQATTDADNGQWGTYVGETYYEHYVWMNGGEVMNADLFGTQCLLNEDKAVEALKHIYDLIYGPNPVAPQPGAIPEYGIHSVFTTGKVAFVEAHSWTVTNYIRECDFDWDFADLPVAPGGGKAGLTFADGYGVATKTKAPDAAITLLKFMTSQWAAKAMALSIVGLQPTRRSVAEQWDCCSLGAQAGKDVGAFSRIMDDARLDPAFQDNDAVGDIFNPIWDQIWITNDIGLEEGLDLIVERIDEYFAA